MYRGKNAIFPRKSKTKNFPVKNVDNGIGYNAIFPEKVRLKITQSKSALTVHRVLCHFPRKTKITQS